MITKSLIAAAAVAASVAAFAPAPAQAGVDVDINFGVGGFYPGYGYGYGHGYRYGQPYHYRPYHQPYRAAISCSRGKNVVMWSGFNSVRSVDCSLPGYKYTGWKRGHKYVVKVNGGGNITGVNRVN